MGYITHLKNYTKMENTIENMELEVMRRQMETLRRKLEQQEIVNDKIIRRAMRDRFSPVMRNKIIGLTAQIFGIFYCYYIFTTLVPMSWAFIIFTEFFLFLALIWTLVTYRNFKSSDFISDNLINVKRKVLRMKLYDRRWKFIAYPFVIVFFSWFLTEVIIRYDLNAFAIGGMVGGAIGLGLGFIMQRSHQRAINDVIKELEELTENE